MALMKRGDVWYFKKMINGQRFVVSTGFADRKSAERRVGDRARHPLQWSSMEFKRITINPRQMGGVPCLRGLRIPVAIVVALVAERQAPEQILALDPDLEAEDIRKALLFAAEAVRERTLPLAAGG